MFKTVGLWLLVFGLSSCEGEQTESSLSDVKIVRVLVDVHIAEAALQEFPPELQDSVMRVYYDQIFQIHKITETDFKKSMEALEANPEKMEKLYGQTIDGIDKKRVKIGKPEDLLPKRDSLLPRN